MILTVVGARPQFIKAAVVSDALKLNGIEESIIHTGQHYDENMNDVFWRELNLPKIVHNLNVGSNTQGVQTARIIEGLENYLLHLDIKPTAILLYGDTNSTLGGAIVASKLMIPIIHIEAGLRSFNREMPEEINRIVTDHLSSLLFCSSTHAEKQLIKEGIKEGIYVCGDVMHDAVLKYSEIAKNKHLSNILKFEPGRYCLLTLHRPSNTDEIKKLEKILNELNTIPIDIVWPIHPRVASKLEKLKLPPNVHMIPPLSYLEMLVVLENSYKVFTDSGGLQKEAYWLKKPCITLRYETEWVETLEGGWNLLNGEVDNSIINNYLYQPDPTMWRDLYGKGDASLRIVSIIKQKYY